MKKSDLKILIKKVQNECALEEPTHITYYWNEDHKLVFKLFFDSLIIPEELMVDEDNISKCFSEQNVYEFEDDFVIKELNREKGYIEVIPDDQKFKVINSYKDYNEDEKDVKNESIVHLAGERISETFAKTKGFVLREAGNPPQPHSITMVAIAFTLEALSDLNKKDLKDLLDALKTLQKSVVGKGAVLKLFVEIPLAVEQLLGVAEYSNFDDFLRANFAGTDWEDSILIIGTDRAKEMVRTADPDLSYCFALNTNMMSALADCGLNAFKNAKNDVYNKIDQELKGSKVQNPYKSLIDNGQKQFKDAQKQADEIIQRFINKFQLKNGLGSLVKNLEKHGDWKQAKVTFDGIQDKKPPVPEWSIMTFVSTSFTFGQYLSNLSIPDSFTKEFKNQWNSIVRDFKTSFGSKGAVIDTLKGKAVDTMLHIHSLGVKTADATKETGGIWQDTEMKKGKSSAGIDMEKDKEKSSKEDTAINVLYYLNVFTFFAMNQGLCDSIKKDILLIDPKA